MQSFLNLTFFTAFQSSRFFFFFKDYCNTYTALSMSPPHPPRVAADEEIKLNDRFPNSIREPLEPRAGLHEIRNVWPLQAIARF